MVKFKYLIVKPFKNSTVESFVYLIIQLFSFSRVQKWQMFDFGRITKIKSLKNKYIFLTVWNLEFRIERQIERMVGIYGFDYLAGCLICKSWFPFPAQSTTGDYLPISWVQQVSDRWRCAGIWLWRSVGL